MDLMENDPCNSLISVFLSSFYTQVYDDTYIYIYTTDRECDYIYSKLYIYIYIHTQIVMIYYIYIYSMQVKSLVRSHTYR